MTAPPTIPEVDAIPVESFDEEPTPREAPRLASGTGDRAPVTGRVGKYEAPDLEEVRAVMGGAGSTWDVANTEWARRVEAKVDDHCATCNARWRKLQGEDEQNGRLGRMDRRIDDAAAYIAKEKARQKKILAGLFTVALGCGGVAKVVLAAREAAAAKAARIELRIEHLERDLYREKRP